MLFIKQITFQNHTRGEEFFNSLNLTESDKCLIAECLAVLDLSLSNNTARVREGRITSVLHTCTDYLSTELIQLTYTFHALVTARTLFFFFFSFSFFQINITERISLRKTVKQSLEVNIAQSVIAHYSDYYERVCANPRLQRGTCAASEDLKVVIRYVTSLQLCFLPKPPRK